MNFTDLKRLIRIYNRAEDIGLIILSGTVQQAVRAASKKDFEEARSRLEVALTFCNIATKAGTDEAKQFAPGAGVIIKNILDKLP